MYQNIIKVSSIKIVSFLIFLIIFIFPSPLISYYLFPGSYLSIISALLCILLLCRDNSNIGYPSLFISLFFIIYYFTLASLIQNTTIISLTIGLPLCLIVYSLCGNKLLAIMNNICNLATPFFILATLSIIMSLVYAYSGGTELFTIENPDGRNAGFYLSSLSNSKFGDIIRPSFIYDEAGTYSFYLTVFALFRLVLNKKPSLTLIILYCSIVTFSLTHFIICILFTIRLTNIKQLIFTTIPIILIAISLLTTFSEKLNFFTDRISYNTVHENNRTAQLHNFNGALLRNENILLFGNLECLERNNSICTEDGDISSSPVTPIYRLGIIGFLIQISFLVLSLFNYKKPNCVFFAIVLNLILLQRPFYTSIYYSFSIFIFIYYFLLLNSNFFGIKKNI